MKQFFTLFILVFSLALNAQESTISLVSDVWPPFTDTKEKKSIANELVQEALNRMEISSSIHIESFDNVLADLESNKYAGSAALWFKSEREEYLIFSKPYLQNQLMLVSKKGTAVNGLSIQDLKGKRIGVVEGYAYSLIENPEIELVYSKSDQQNVEKLFVGQLDYILVDDLVLSYMMKYEMNNIMDALAVSNIPYETKTLHFALNKQVAGADKMIADFDLEIQAMIKDGTFLTILGMQWIEADVNNDGVPELVLRGDAAGEISPEDAYKLFHEMEPIAKEEEKEYYINGVMYHDWEDVPDRYKSNPQNIPPPESYSPGIRVKF